MTFDAFFVGSFAKARANLAAGIEFGEDAMTPLFRNGNRRQ